MIEKGQGSPITRPKGVYRLIVIGGVSNNFGVTTLSRRKSWRKTGKDRVI